MVRSRIKIYSNHACNLLVVIHINHTKNTLLHLIYRTVIMETSRKSLEKDRGVGSGH